MFKNIRHNYEEFKTLSVFEKNVYNKIQKKTKFDKYNRLVEV